MRFKNCRFEFTESKSDGTKGEFEGHAAVFNNVDLGGDTIKPGAFRRTLKSLNYEAPILWSHDTNLPLGTAKLEESDRGLKVHGKINLNVPHAQWVYELMHPLEGFKRAAIRGMSFGYDVVKHTYEGKVRVLSEVKLYEVSPVVFGMNPKATIQRVKADEMPIEGEAPAEDAPAAEPELVLHALKFSKEMFESADACVAWAEENEYDASTVEEAESAWVLIQRPADEFDPESWQTEDIADGVQAIFGVLVAKSKSLKGLVLATLKEVRELKATLVDQGWLSDPDLIHSLRSDQEKGLGRFVGDSRRRRASNDPGSYDGHSLDDLLWDIRNLREGN